MSARLLFAALMSLSLTACEPLDALFGSDAHAPTLLDGADQRTGAAGDHQVDDVVELEQLGHGGAVGEPGDGGGGEAGLLQGPTEQADEDGVALCRLTPAL